MTEETLFELARKTPEAERAALLERTCEGKPELRARVEALLRADAAASPLSKQSPLLEQTAGFSHTVAQASPDAVGTLIDGRFKLLQKLGEGGMGTVWVAEQEQPVKRRVALKLIKAGMDSAQVIRRFEAERQALALMDHTNIAKVLDAGTTDNGRPYFVMELVKGVPITKYCDEIHASIKNRLELFVQVCSAVQHAHQKGIIHRDIKPSNILVAMQDGKPVPKVIDFGVAKALHSKLADKTMYTEIGQIIGTLEYMAPEQAELSAMDIDTRADIYALGVLLYELLTGSTPITRERMKSAAFAEVIRLIKEEDPPKPSTRLTQSKDSLANLAALRKTDPKHLSAELKGELDWVVLKALEKDRTCRYETANGLARDIQRYLADEVVEARPPSAGYRLRKFVRRNTGKVWAAGLIALALVLGVIGTTWGLLEAKQQERFAMEAAVQERQAKQREAERAEGEKQAKEDAIAKRKEAETNLAFAKKANDILGSVFTGLDPKANYATVGELSQTLKDNLKKAVEQLEGSAIGDPLTVARMQNTLGLSLLGLGESQLAIEMFSKALATQKEKLGIDNPDTLGSMNNLATSYQTSGLQTNALPLLEVALKHMKEIYGTDHAETLNCMNNLAVCYSSAGKLNLAITLAEETLKLSKSKLGTDHVVTLAAMNNLATDYRDTGKYDQALALFEETLKLTQKKLGDDHPDSLVLMNNVANCCQAAGKLSRSLLIRKETFRLMKNKLGIDHPRTIKCMNNLAVDYRADGELDQALSLQEEAFKLSKAVLGSDHPDTLSSMNSLAECYRAANKIDLAMPLYEETLRLRIAKLTVNHPATLTSKANLAECYRAARKFDLALPLHEETHRLRKNILGENHPDTLLSMGFLASSYKNVGKIEMALPLFEETVKRMTNVLGENHPHRLSMMHNLSAAYWATGKFDQAIQLNEETLRRSRLTIGADHPETLFTMENLGFAYCRTGQGEKASVILTEYINKQRKRLTKNDPQFANLLVKHAKDLLQCNQTVTAGEMLEEALAIREKTQPDNWTTFNTQSLLGEALLGQKKYAEAEPLLVKGYEGIKAREKTIPPQSSTRLFEALDRLIQFYTEINKPDEVKKWQAEKEKLPKPVEKK